MIEVCPMEHYTQLIIGFSRKIFMTKFGKAKLSKVKHFVARGL
jgi:hypothetical protein